VALHTGSTVLGLTRSDGLGRWPAAWPREAAMDKIQFRCSVVDPVHSDDSFHFICNAQHSHDSKTVLVEKYHYVDNNWQEQKLKHMIYMIQMSQLNWHIIRAL